MKRDLARLTSNSHDLLVIGGGIYGACVARDASLRGLSVALVEKGDFGHATSANSLKVIHGGLRYLQQADLKRMRESIRERMVLMRLAPHLVHPLPFLMPTYGHLMKGREIMAVALMVNDLVSFDRNRLKDPEKHLPRGRIVPRRRCLQLSPGISEEGLTGGAIWHDCQMYNSERLTLSFIRSATSWGADVANYVEVKGFLQENGHVTGVRAKDLLTGEALDIRARISVNTAGPWIDRVLRLLRGQRPQLGVRLAKAINLVTRPLFQTYGVGVSAPSDYRDSDPVINKGSRLLFVIPWRGRSLIGTTYAVYEEDPDDFRVTEEDIENLLDEINRAIPSAKLTREDVYFVHAGLVPISGTDRETRSVQRARHHEIHDHQYDGVKGLISVVGVKYTTARNVAEKVTDRVFETWGQKPPQSNSSVTPLHGGQIERFEAFLQAEIGERRCGLGDRMIRHLVYNYGSAYPEVLRYFDRYPAGSQDLSDYLAVLRAEVLHGIHEEMAQKLVDVVFRRTDLGTVGHPGDGPLGYCADVMGKELGWSPKRIQQELQEANGVFDLSSR